MIPDTPEKTTVVADIDMTDLARRWRTLAALGVLTIAAGIAAIILPRTAALAINLLIGLILLFDGVLGLVHAYHLRHRKGALWQLVAALVALGIGLFLLTFPLAGVLTLAVVIGIFLLLAGFFKSLLAVQLRPLYGWGWLLLNGILVLVLGVLVLLLWPDAAPWVVGLLLGIDLTIGGVWLVAVAFAARKWRDSLSAGSAASGVQV